MRELVKNKKTLLLLLWAMTGAGIVFALENSPVHDGKRTLSSSEVMRRFRGVSTLGPFSSTKVLEILRSKSHRASPASQSQFMPAIDEQELVKKLSEYFYPTEAELLPLFESARGARVVTDNPVYSTALSGVMFKYQPERCEVNAAAALIYIDKQTRDIIEAGEETNNMIKQHPERYTGPGNMILLFGGAVRFSRVAALAFAAEMNGDTGATERLINAIGLRHYINMDGESTVQLLNDAELLSLFADINTLNKAKNISAGMLMGILGHETGHVALSHTRSPGYDKQPNEVSRDQELQADAFASSIIATSPFPEYILKGTLLFHYIGAKKQFGGGTHPYAEDRFHNFISQNSELAASLGITAY